MRQSGAVIDILLVAVGALGLAVAALSGRLRRLPLSEPLLGLILGVVLGPGVVGVLDVPLLEEDPQAVHEGTRLLLAVSVMAVALRYPIRELRPLLRPLALLLAIVLPAMALLSAVSTAAVLGVGVASAALVGAALAPTDPVLASSVVTGDPAERDLPARARRLLSLESGANDGLALPLVLLALAVAGVQGVGTSLVESVWQVLGAVLVGLGAGWVGGRALRSGEGHGAVEPGPALLFTLLLALAVLGASGLLGVDGILAVFVAGLAFNGASTGAERSGDVPIDEAVNRFLVLPLFVVLGAALPWAAWAELGWRGPVLVVVILLLRRLPVLLVLRRPLGLGRADAVFLGWYGPIGVSALFYLALQDQRAEVDPVVLTAGTLLVAASTVVHGLTTAPGRRLYRHVAGSPGRAGDPSAAGPPA